jgi:hypothetical protein
MSAAKTGRIGYVFHRFHGFRALIVLKPCSRAEWCYFTHALYHAEPRHALAHDIDWEGTTMKDAMTKQPLYVSTDGTAGPYIMVPVTQLDELRRFLDQHGVRYSVDEDAISLNGEPEVGIVNLGRAGDAKTVQRILDSVG